jgi:hypothetical protein
MLNSESERSSCIAEDNRSHLKLHSRISIEEGRFTCGDEVVLVAGRPYPVLFSKDDMLCEVKVKGVKAGHVCG